MRIHLTGYKGTRKETLCNWFVSGLDLKELGYQIYGQPGKTFAYPVNPKRVALADSLKKEACSYLGLPLEWVENGTFEKMKKTLLNIRNRTDG